MRQTINSPLAPCQLPESGQLSPYQAIGVVTDLAINHSYYDELTVEEALARVIPALESGNAKIFFDDNRRPYGYASWTWLSDEAHRSLLTGDDDKLMQAAHFFKASAGTNLWFFDLLFPFTSLPTVFQMLKAELGYYDYAYATQNILGNSNPSRRVW